MKVAFDSGATASIISYRKVIEQNLKINPSYIEVKVADYKVPPIIGITDRLMIDYKHYSID